MFAKRTASESGAMEAGQPRLRQSHMPALDGLRGIAIILVLLHHAWVFSPFVPTTWTERAYAVFGNAGWIGVDLFFVLSGFLITGILVDTKGSAQFFQKFFARRILRIFPLYYASLLLFLVILPRAGFLTSDLLIAQENQFWFWTYFSNVLIASDGWQESSLFLSHFWSLAVEEQFYMIWPFAVAWLSRNRLMKLCFLAIPLAWSARFVLALMDNNIAAYVLMPARLSTLLVGAWFALYVRSPASEKRVDLRRVLLGASILLVLLGVVVTMDRGLQNLTDLGQLSGFPAVAGLAGLAIFFASSRESLYTKALSSGVLRFFGRYSYAIYIWHLPLILILARTSFMRSTQQSLGPLSGHGVFVLITMGASIVAALLSWNLLEKHFLRLKEKFEYAR